MSKRVLVVEDDPSIRELLQLHLGLAGFDVDDVADGREGLDRARAGADDYLSKPFGVRELQARIAAVMRRGRHAVETTPADEDPPVLPLAEGIAMDMARRTVFVHGTPIDLTRQEFDLLHQLASRRGIVFSRARLLQTVWSGDAYVTERTVDTVVSRLRKKLEADPRQPSLILTAWGIGYKFADT